MDLRFSDPSLGGRFHTPELTGSWQEYLTAARARLHALALAVERRHRHRRQARLLRAGRLSSSRDVLKTLFLGRPQCCTFLPGYPPNSFVGDHYQIVSAEYRAPLHAHRRGYQTFPRLHPPAVWAPRSSTRATRSRAGFTRRS
jgi:hypothetical protein